MNWKLFAILLFLIFAFTSHGIAKNIVICFDGTGNHPDDARKLDKDTTNVYKLKDTLVENSEQVVKYFAGVGTSGWKVWDIKGTYFGLGAKGKRDEAYEFLEKNYAPGDKLFLFGFSRGAAIARDLANYIFEKGVNGHRQLLIEVLGIWDTVAAFGIPMDILGFPTGRIDLGKKLDVPLGGVNHTYHLVSIDETREPYTPTLVEKADNVEEVWFAGVHADIGGGSPERKLADITLRFMIERVKKHGLRFDDTKVTQVSVNDDGRGKMHPYDGSIIPTRPRQIFVRENNTVSKRQPKIHQTVIDRMRNYEYAPQNLLSLDGNYEIVR